MSPGLAPPPPHALAAIKQTGLLLMHKTYT